VGYLATIRRIRDRDFSRASAAERDQAARDVVGICSFACAGLVLQPIPGLEQAVLPVQVGMVGALAHVHGQELGRKRALEVVLDLAAVTGASVVGRQALTTLAKFFLPGMGGVLAAPYTFSVTWGTGYAARHYFRTGRARPDPAAIKRIFEEERERSRAHYTDARARAARPDRGDLDD
jgi:uncharacterized protein (DUF697 family)